MSDFYPGEVPPDYQEQVVPQDGQLSDALADLAIVRGGGKQLAPEQIAAFPITPSDSRRPSAWATPPVAEQGAGPTPEPERVEYAHGDDFARVATEADEQQPRDRVDWAAPVPVVPPKVSAWAGRVVERIAGTGGGVNGAAEQASPADDAAGPEDTAVSEPDDSALTFEPHAAHIEQASTRPGPSLPADRIGDSMPHSGDAAPHGEGDASDEAPRADRGWMESETDWTEVRQAGRGGQEPGRGSEAAEAEIDELASKPVAAAAPEAFPEAEIGPPIEAGSQHGIPEEAGTAEAGEAPSDMPAAPEAQQEEIEEVIDPEIVPDDFKAGPNPDDIVDAEVVEEHKPVTGQELTPADSDAEPASEPEVGEMVDGEWVTPDGKHEGQTQQEWNEEQAAEAESIRKAMEELAAQMKAEYDAKMAEEAARRLAERAERIKAENQAYDDMINHLEEIFEQLDTDHPFKWADDTILPEETAAAAAAEQVVPPEPIPPQPEAPAETPAAAETPVPPVETPEHEPADNSAQPADTPQQPEPRSDVPPASAEGLPEWDLRRKATRRSKAMEFFMNFAPVAGRGTARAAEVTGSAVAAVIGAFGQKMNVVGVTPSASGGFDVVVGKGDRTVRLNVRANSAAKAKAQFDRFGGNLITRFRAAWKLN